MRLSHVKHDGPVRFDPLLPLGGLNHLYGLHTPIVDAAGRSRCRLAYTPDPDDSGGNIDIAVLASGSGTNLQALIDTPEVRRRIRLVLSDRPGAKALERAAAAGIPGVLVRYDDFADRSAFSSAVADLVEDSGAKGVVFAGFMRVLTGEFVNRFPNRILNLHPSLLPAFPGANAVRDALDHGVEVTGVTVHIVDEKVDHGPIVAQRPVLVEPGDTVETLHARIQAVEHVLYPEMVMHLLTGAIQVFDGKVVIR